MHATLQLTTAITGQHATENYRKHHPIVELSLSLSGKLDTLIPMMLSELRPAAEKRNVLPAATVKYLPIPTFFRALRTVVVL